MTIVASAVKKSQDSITFGQPSQIHPKVQYDTNETLDESSIDFDLLYKTNKKLNDTVEKKRLFTKLV